MKRILLAFSLLWGLLALGQTKTLSDDLVFSFPMDGNVTATATDASGNARNGTVSGGVTATTDRFGNANGAYAFDGSTGFIEIKGTDNLNFPTADFAVSYWAYQTTITGNGAVLTKDKGCDPLGPFRLGGDGAINNGSALYYALGGQYGSATNKGNVSNATIQQINQWTHYAFTRTNNVLSVYVNGVLVDQTSGTNTSTNAYTYKIGKWDVTGTCTAKYFSGKLDDLRMYKRALTEDEITQLYEQNSLMASFPFDGSATDLSPNNWQTTASAGVDFTASNRFGKTSSAVAFSGVQTDGIRLVNSAKAFKILPLSVSFWFNASAGGAMINKYYSSSSKGFNICIEDAANGVGQLRAWYFKDGGNAVGPSNQTLVKLNTWYHAVVTYRSDSAVIYLNDVKVQALKWIGTAAPVDNDTLLHIGYYPNGGTSQFKGKLDDIKIYNRTLTPAEIITTYNKEGGSDVGSLFAYYPFDGNANDVSGNGLNGTVGTGATLAKDRFGRANSAYFINSTTDGYGPITVAGFGKNMPTDEITVSIWTKTAKDCPDGGLFVLTPDDGVNRFNVHLRMDQTNTNILYWDYGNITGAGTGRSSALLSTIGDTAWVHYAFVYRKGTTNTMEVYRNGLLFLTKTTTTAFTPRDASLLFGNVYKGTIDDARFYKRALSPAEIAKLAGNNVGLAFDGTQKTTAYASPLSTSTTTATIPNPFTTSNIFTAEMWVKPTNIEAGKYLGFFGANTSTDGRPVPALYVYGDQLQFDLNPNKTIPSPTTGLVPGFFSLNQWTHVAMVSDGVTCYIYKNGELKYTCPFLSSMASATSTSVIFLGANGSALTGQMDEVRVWSVARTQAQIRASMYQEFNTPQPGLSASYSFNGSMVNAVNGVAGTLTPVASATPTIYTASSALRTPTMLPATDASAIGFVANWNAHSSAIGFQLQQSVNGNLWTNTSLTTPTATSQSITADSLYLRVRAIFAVGDTSDWSAAYRASRLFAPAGLAVSFNPTNVGKDNTNHYIQVPSGAWFKGDFTVTSWVYIRDYSGKLTRIFDFGNGLASNNLLFDPARGILDSYNGGKSIGASQVAPVPTGHWVNVAITLKSNIATIYYDGVAQAVVPLSSNVISIPNGTVTNNNYIGRSNWGENYLNFMLDEFCIYNKALTKEEINARMGQHLTGSEDGLILYYDFDNINGLNGTVVTDRSASKKDGVFASVTNTGLPTWVKSGVSLVPTMLPATNVSTTGFTANWAFPAAKGYQLQQSVNGNDWTINTVQSETFKSFTTDSLYLRVRAIVAVGDTTGWSSVYRASRLFAPAGLAVSLNPTNKIESSQSVDKTKQIVQVPSDVWFKGDFTVSTWVYVRSAMYNDRIFEFGNGNGGGTAADHILMKATPTVNSMCEFTIYKGTVNTTLNVAALPVGKWVQVAITLSGTTARIYYDGVLKATSLTMNIPNNVLRQFCYLGGHNYSSGDRFANIMLDEFCIYNKALSQDEIKARMGQHLTGSEDGLILYYDFDNINGNIVVDRSASKKDGLLTSVNTTGVPALVKSSISITPTLRAATNVTPAGFTANWDAFVGASAYEVQFASKSDFSDTTKVEKTTETSKAVTPTFSPVYFRVRAVNGSNKTDWASKMYFVAPGNGVDLANTTARLCSNTEGQYVQVPAGKWLSGNFTVDAWVYLRSNFAYQRLFDFGLEGGAIDNKILALSGSANNNPYYRVGSSDVQFLNTTFPLNQWVHIALSNDSTNKTSRVFINGDIVYTGNTTSTLVAYKSNFIGRSNWIAEYSLDNYTNAIIDEFHISNQALSRDSIIARSHRHLTGNESDLILYYDFDQINGSSIPNLATKTGAAGNGTVYKSAAFVSSKALLTPFVRPASNVTLKGFTANWDKIEGASSYEIQQSQTTDFSAATSITQTDNKLDISPSYSPVYFRVRAVTGSSKSDWDSTVYYTAPGNAISFANGSASVPYDSAYNTKKFTISFWANPKQGTAHQTPIGSRGTATFQGYNFNVFYDGASVLNNKWMFNMGGASEWKSLTGPIVLFGVWSHVAVSYDGAKAKMYINGEKVDEIAVSNYLPNASLQTYFGRLDASNYQYSGSLDEVSFWNKALDESQIRTLSHRSFDAQVSKEGLVAYFDFDQSDAKTLTNKVSNKTIATTLSGTTPTFAPSKALLTPFVRKANTDIAGFTATWDSIPGATNYVVEKQNGTTWTNIAKPTNTSYRFDNVADAITYRISAVTSSQTSEASTATVMTAPGNAMTFASGQGAIIGTSVASTINLSNKFTVEEWVNLKTAPTKDYMAFFSFGAFSTNSIFLLYRTNGKMEMWVCGGSDTWLLRGDVAGTPGYVPINASFPLNQWVHVAVTVNEKNVKAYLNGDLILNTQLATPFAAGLRTNNYIGWNQGTNQTAAVSFDEFRLFNNVELSQAQIIANSHKHLTGAEQNLALYYDFDQTSGTTAANAVAGGLDVSVVNGVSTGWSFTKSNALLTPFTRAVTDTTTTGFTAHWDKVPGATKYTVQYRDVTQTSFTSASPMNATDTSFSVSGAISGAQYLYQVQAITPSRTSDFTALDTVQCKVAHVGNALNLDNAMAQPTTPAPKYLTIPSFTLGSSFTIEAWVYLNGNTGQNMRLFDFGAPQSTTSTILFAFNADNTAGIHQYNNGVQNPISIATPFPLKQWTHVAYVVNGLSSSVYYNGVKVGSRTLATQFSQVTRTSNFIGKSNWTNPYGNIMIDEFRIYNTALTENQLSERAFRQLNSSECADNYLVAYYDFDKVTSPTVVPNLSKTASMDATIVGGAGYVPSKAQLTPFVSTASTDSTITLSWKQIPDATFTVRQATNAAFTADVTITTPATSPLTLKNLAPNTSYWFAVQAKVGNDTSAWITTTARTLSLTDSLIAFYPFNNSAIDASNHGANGTLSSATTVVAAPDRFGNKDQAYKFDKGFITVPSAKNNLDGEYTIAAWVNSTDGASHAVVSKYNWAAGTGGNKFDGYMLSLSEGSGKLTQVNTSNPSNYIVSNTAVPLSQWSFVCATYSADKTVTLWLNGDTVFTKKNVSANTANAYTFYIGAYYGQGNPFIGSIDDIRLFRRPLSKKEITSLYHENGWPYIGVQISSNKITEQQAKGIEVGTLSPLIGATVVNEAITYSLVAGAGSTDNAKFTIDGEVLKSAAIFDTTVQTTASIRVRATTASGVVVESPLTIQIVGAVKTDVYTFDKTDALSTDSWIVKDMSVASSSGKDGSAALTANANASASNSVSKLFNTIIADNVNLQYTFGYDVSSSNDGTTFGITTDANTKDTAFTFTSKANGAAAFNVLGQDVAALAIPQGWARVEVLVSKTDNVTLQVSVRARSLATATSTWTTVVAPKTLTLDNGLSASNLTSWKNLFIKNATSACVLDNLSLSVRTLNPNFTTLNDGLIAFYNMDDNMRDTSGNGNHGLKNGTTAVPTATTNRFNQANSAYYFDGANFSVAKFSGKLPAKNVTFSVWVQQDETKNSSLFVLKDDNNDNRVNVHTNWGDGPEKTLYWDYGNITSGVGNGRSQKLAPAFNTNWNHYVFVSGDNGMKVFVNGVLYYDKPQFSEFNNKIADTALLIGSYLDANLRTGSFKGKMDDLRIYNRELAADEVSRLYYEGGWPVQQITASDVSVKEGATVKLPVSLTPADAPSKGLVFTSKNTAVATVDSRGVVTGVSIGSAIISVATANGSVRAEAVVSVVSKIEEATQINILDSAVTLIKGETRKLQYSITPATDVNTSNLAWEAKNEYYVSVSEGTITAKEVFNNALVYLYADTTNRNVKDYCYVTVLPSAKPTLTADTAQHFSLRAVDAKLAPGIPRDTLKIDLSLFFTDAEDSVLTYSCAPQANSKDTLQWYMSNNMLYIYQWSRDTAQILPSKLTVTAADSDKQTVSKDLFVQMKTIADQKPVIKPAKFATMYQFRRSASLDLRKYVSDDFTPFNSLVFDSLTVSGDSLTTALKNGVLTISTKRVNDVQGTVALRVKDSRKQWTELVLPYEYKYVDNNAPAFTAIDTAWQKTVDGKKGIVQLASYVKDDYTPTSKLKWSVVPTKNVNYTLTDSVLTLSASSTAWSGTENVIIAALDEGNKKGLFVIPFTQVVSSRVSGTPEVDYELFLAGSGRKVLPSVIAKKTEVKAIYKTIGITADSWNWSFPGTSKLDVAGGDSVVVSYDSIGVFGVTLVAINNTGSTTVTHKSINVIGVLADAKRICKGSSVRLWSSDSTAGNQYTWSTKATGVNAITVSPATTTTYKVTITPNGGTSIIDSITISVVEPATNIANDTTVCEGSALTFAPKGFKSLWWNGAKESVSSFTYNATKATTIKVSAISDVVCPVISDEIKVSLSAAPKLNMPTSTVTVCKGSTDTIKVGTNDGAIYSWNQTAGTAKDTLFATSAGKYVVTATFEGGCKTIDSLTVTLSALPTVRASATPTTVCKGSLVKLYTDSLPDLRYNWSTALDAEGQAIVAAVGNNDYVVTATNDAGCKASASVRVIANDKVSVTIPNREVTACAGKLVEFSASGAESYSWSNGATTAGISLTAINGTSNIQKVYVTATKDGCTGKDSVTLTALALPSVTIAAAPNDTLCKGDSLMLTASGADKYQWSSTISNGKNFAIDQSGAYRVLATDKNGCSVESNINIVVNAFTNFKITPSKDSICAGDSVKLEVNAQSFDWISDFKVTKAGYVIPSALGANSYKAQAADANKCTAQAEAVVVVKAIPTISNVKPSDTVCKGLSTVLTAQGGSSYVWNNGVENGKTFSPSETKRYTVTVTLNGCSDTASTNVVIKGESSVTVKTVPSMDTAICAGASLALRASTDGTISNITWENFSKDNIEVTPKVDTTYTVIVTDAQKCVLKKSIPVRLHALPKVIAKADTTVACSGKQVTLTGAGAATYTWNDNLADGAKRLITANTSFTVTGVDANKCVNTATVEVKALQAFKEELGVVTTDSSKSEKVIVAWNRSKGKRTERYIVYRANGAAWDSIGGTKFADASYVFDANVDLKNQSYVYKLVTVDSVCNNKAESKPHRTIHTYNAASGTDNSITVNWNAYEGLDLSEYVVYRIYNGTFTQIGKETIGQENYHVTDPNPVKGSSYRVFFKLTKEVSPLVLKSDTGPFSQSMSNMSEASLVSSSMYSSDELSVWPIPANDRLHIAVANHDVLSIQLISDSGIQLQIPVAKGADFDYATAHIASGLYLLQVQTSDGILIKKVSIQH